MDNIRSTAPFPIAHYPLPISQFPFSIFHCPFDAHLSWRHLLCATPAGIIWSMSSETTTAVPWTARWETGPDWIALVGVLLTVVLSFLTRTVGATGFFIVGAVIFWATYVCWRSR